GCLHLDRGNPLAGDLEHVVGPAGVPEEAVAVTDVFITGADPIALDGPLGLLVLVPVVGTGGIAFDQQVADLAVRHPPIDVVHYPGFVPGHEGPAAARPDLPRAVGDEDVQHFGGADAVQDLDPIPLLPALVEHGRQPFPGGDAGPHGLEGLALVLAAEDG